MVGHFVPVRPFGQLCQSYALITGFIMLFDHQNLSIDTSCGDVGNIGQQMIRNIIFVNGGTFYPCRIILTKVPSSKFFAKMFIFVLVSRNLIMSGVRPDSILGPLWKTSHRLL